MKKLEMFQELSVKLAIIENKIDKLQADIDELKPKKICRESSPISDINWEEVAKIVDKQESKVIPKCLWDGLPPENRYKTLGLSCPCNKCSPYALSGGVSKLVDCISTTFIPSGDLSI